MSQVLVGGTDITDYIVIGSYKMDSADTYESWLDGNYVEHRVITRQKVSGEFNVALTNKNSMLLADFIALWDSKTTNGYTMLTVYVTNKAAMETINAYCTLTSEQHEKLADGSFLDVLNIKVEER